MVEFRAEVLPQRRAVTGPPPRSQSETQHVQYAENRSRADEDSENQADPDKQFDHPDQVAEKDDVRKNDMAEHRAVEADRGLVNVAIERLGKSGMRERASKNFVFPEQNKEDAGTDPGDGKGFGEKTVFRCSQ